MKIESDEDVREYYLSDGSGGVIVKRARDMAAKFGEAFVVFVGSVAVPRTAVGAYSNRQEAIEAARTEAGYHKGFKSAPKVHLKRIKV